MNNELTKSLGVEIKTEITKEDLIAIQVSNIEETLIKNRSDFEGEIETLEKQIEDVSKKIEKEVRAVAQADASKKMEPIRKSSEKIVGSKSEEEIHIEVDDKLPQDPEMIDQKNHYIKYESSFKILKKTGTVKTEDETLFVEYKCKLPVPESVLTLLKQKKELTDNLQSKLETLYKIRSALSNMSRFERQAKKTIAEKLIKASGADIDFSSDFKIAGIPELKFLQ